MKKTDKTLQKCDELIERLGQLKKAIGDVTNVASNRKPVNALGAGWSQDPGTGAFHHSTHGIIGTFKHPEGGFEVRHGGASVGRVPQIGQAGAMIRNYVNNLGAQSTGMNNRPSPNLPAGPKMGVGNSWATKSEGDEMDKSGYGPKGSKLYNPADNARRKAGNVGAERFGNQSTKAYSKNVMAQKVPKGPAGPVKHYSPEQIAAINEANKLKKNAEGSPWMRHGEVPNADYEVQRLQITNPAIAGEDAMANQLANMMQSRAMMRPDHRQPSAEAFIQAGEAMGLAPSEEAITKSEQQWGGAINNWLTEACKPISQRFSSEEEEVAYWSSIKVNGGGGGDYGF